MNPGPSKKLDPLTVEILAKSGKRRRRSPVPAWIMLAVVVLLLGLLAWRIWPDPEPPLLVLAAYDEVNCPEATFSLRAALDREDPAGGSRDLGGRELYFLKQESEEVAVTSTDGSASIEWHAPKTAEAPILFDVRSLKGKKQPRDLHDTGRIFLWPKGGDLLVVDADHALSSAGDDLFRSGSYLEIQQLPGSATALRGLRRRYHIVYVSENMDRPPLYRKMRNWLRQAWATEEEQFPDGPLLSSAVPLGEEDKPRFFADQIEVLKRSFPKAAVAIAARPLEAEMFQDAGWRTYLIGEGEAPQGVIAVPSWDELAKKLNP